MIKIEVRGMRDVMRKLEALPSELRDKALAPALNKVSAKARSEMSRRIRDEFAIKAGDVNPLLAVTPASAKTGRIVAVLSAFPRRRGRRSRNVMMFDARQAPGKKTKRVRVQVAPGAWRWLEVPVGGGVTVKIRRDGGRQLIRGAFIGNKGRTVFVRTGAGRLPIRPVETIDVPQMFNTRRINAAVIRRIRDELPIEVDRAIRLVLSRQK